MISLLTNVVIDVGAGVVWWLTKTTYYGIQYGVSKLVWVDNELIDGKPTDNEFILMSDFKHMLDEKNNKIKELENRISNSQFIVIDKINNNS